MARCGQCWARCGVQWPDNGGAPSWRGLGDRPLATCASGLRRRMRWPRCSGLAKGRGPLPSRDNVGDGKAMFMGNASGHEGTRCQPSVLRKRRCVPLSSLRSSWTPKGRMSQAHAHHGTGDPGSPEGCSQPSSPPLCGGVMTVALPKEVVRGVGARANQPCGLFHGGT